jgi:hypothetical protein
MAGRCPPRLGRPSPLRRARTGRRRHGYGRHRRLQPQPHCTFREEDEHPRPARLIQRIAQADYLIAPDGLRVRDTATGLTVSPSCCCGLETWQEWNQVAAGQSLWLGHSPTPWVEHLGHTIRVWPDGGDEAVPPAGTSPIEIPVSDLPGLIASAHKQLQNFLDLLEPWSPPLAGTTASSLGPALTAHFHVSWPAPTP